MIASFKKHSKAEYEIVDFLKETYPELEIWHDTINNRKIISPKEIDIYLPTLKIGIEFDGIYWHQSKSYTDNNMIFKKTIMCEEQNIHLIHIYEDEWKDQQDFIKKQFAT